MAEHRAPAKSTAALVWNAGYDDCPAKSAAIPRTMGSWHTTMVSDDPVGARRAKTDGSPSGTSATSVETVPW